MEPYQTSVVAGCVLGGGTAFYGAWSLAAWRRRRSLARAARRGGPVPAAAAGTAAGTAADDPLSWRIERRMEAIEAAQAGLAERLEAFAAEGGEARLQAVAGSLVGLIKDKNATLEVALAGLDQLRARLKALEQMGDLAEARGLFERLGTRLDEVQAAQATAQAATEARLAALQAGGENPFAEISAQLTRLYAQKDATVETVFARLAPLEAQLAKVQQGLAARDPQAALDGFALRLEALQGRLADLETPGENPFAEISEQLTRLYAQKDATVETVFARLAPLEARLGELAARDPQAALDGFASRLEALQGRLADLETPGENPFAEISEQLTRLYAQKDATVETVFARLAPLEARLDELQQGLARLAPLAEDDPRAALEGLRVRVEALHWAQGEVAAGLAALQAAGAEGGGFAEIADRLTRLYAQKDASVAALIARLAPLENRLGELEARPWDPDADEARAQAQAIAAQLIAARAAAEHTQLFADRLALLEASLPRLSAAQAQAMQATGRRPGPRPPAGPGPEAAPPAVAPDPAAPAPDLEAVWTLPRIVSLHHK